MLLPSYNRIQTQIYKQYIIHSFTKQTNTFTNFSAVENAKWKQQIDTYVKESIQTE